LDAISVSCAGWWLQTLNIVLTGSFRQYQSLFGDVFRERENPPPGGLSKPAVRSIVSVKLEKEPASLLPVQSPPQHGFIHATGSRFGQAVVRSTF
jgi:hypothetical protein